MSRTTDFVDYDSIPVEHRDAVSLCVSHGLMNGKDNGEFDPNGYVTLGEICKIACNVLRLGEYFTYDRLPDRLGLLEKGHWAQLYINFCRTYDIYIIDGNTISPNEFATYDQTREISIRIYKFITDDLCNFETKVRMPQKERITRSCLAVELSSLCQAIGKWYLDQYEEYFVPSQDKLSTIFAFVTFLPENHSDASYVFNFAYKMGLEPKSIPFEPVYELLSCKNTHIPFCSSREDVYHFTKLETLKLLISPDARFRLHNAEFLNDPSEGQVLLEQLAHYIKENDKIDPGLLSWLRSIGTVDVHKTFRPNNTYIASFQSAEGMTLGNLPMWYTYADSCKGCAIKFAVDSFNCNLYRVHYSEYEAEEFLHDFISILSKHWSRYGPDVPDGSTFFWNIAADILSQSTYLFKDHNFSYENEVRAIMFCPPQKAHRAAEIRDGELLPRTFCETPFEIKHVIFGPAVSDPKRLAVGFAGMGLNCTFEKSNIPFTSV